MTAPERYRIDTPGGDTLWASDLDEAREVIIEHAEEEDDAIVSFSEYGANRDPGDPDLDATTESGGTYIVRAHPCM